MSVVKKRGETLKQSVVFSAVGSIGTHIITLVGFILLARMLSPHEFGLMAIIAIFTAFATIFIDMGMGAALIHNQKASELHYSTAFWFCVFVGLMFCGFMLISAGMISVFFGEEDLENLAIFCAWLIPLNALSIVPFSLLQKRREFRRTAQIEVVSVFCGLTLALVMASQHFGIWSLVANLFCVSALRVILCSFTSHWYPGWYFRKKEFNELWSYSGYLFASSLFSYIVENIDKLLVGKYINSTILGSYTYSNNIANLPSNLVVKILNRVFFPTFVSIQSDIPRIRNMYMKVLRLVAFFTFPLMLSMSALSDYIVLALFGNKWTDMIMILNMFGIIYLLRTIASLNGPIYLSQGATKLQMYLTLAMRGNVLVATVIGVQFGIEGLMWGLLISRIVNFIPALYFPGRIINVTMSDYHSCLSRTFASGLCMFIGLLITKQYIQIQHDSILSLVFYVVLAASIYLLISFVINRVVFREVYLNLLSRV